ncbi:MAG: DUF6111 family protein [Alphaproteobacteria bacterium]
MIRILLTTVVPLLLPILAYVGWLVLSGRIERRRAAAPEARQIPWAPLIAAGVVLTAVTLVATSLVVGTPPWGEHVPPRLDDGRVVPGGVR